MGLGGGGGGGGGTGGGASRSIRAEGEAGSGHRAHASSDTVIAPLATARARPSALLKNESPFALASRGATISRL